MPGDQPSDVPYYYTRIFQPTGPDGTRPLPPLSSVPSTMSGDATSGLEYVYNEQIILAVNVAIATGRPLLVSGPPGSGKSSLARSIAKWQGWHYYEEVVTSRTQARDFLWRFDTLRRLGDAQIAGVDARARERLNHLAAYVDPGILWWAFDPDSALRRGSSTITQLFSNAQDPRIVLGASPSTSLEESREGADADSLQSQGHAVVLIDEIDKADPDIPNDLLIPLGSLSFTVSETATTITLSSTRKPPLIIITTNRERELPNAFLRRCLTLTLPNPTAEWLVAIATRRFGPDADGLYLSIAQRVIKIQEETQMQAPPGTAEFLDALLACQELGVHPETHQETWEMIQTATLLKGRILKGLF